MGRVQLLLELQQWFWLALKHCEMQKTQNLDAWTLVGLTMNQHSLTEGKSCCWSTLPTEVQILPFSLYVASPNGGRLMHWDSFGLVLENSVPEPDSVSASCAQPQFYRQIHLP